MTPGTCRERKKSKKGREINNGRGRGRFWPPEQETSHQGVIGVSLSSQMATEWTYQNVEWLLIIMQVLWNVVRPTWIGAFALPRGMAPHGQGVRGLVCESRPKREFTQPTPHLARSLCGARIAALEVINVPNCVPIGSAKSSRENSTHFRIHKSQNTPWGQRPYHM